MLAMYRLGAIYLDGLGTQESCHLGVGFFKNMAEKGDWDVSYHREARVMYDAGDLEGAFISYALSAEMGVEESQINTAWIIDSGEWDPTGVIGSGVDVWRIALTFWNRAANQGNVDARVKMGDYHFAGLGMENNTSVDEEAEEMQVPTVCIVFILTPRIILDYL
jgi:SEL1 protein